MLIKPDTKIDDRDFASEIHDLQYLKTALPRKHRVRALEDTSFQQKAETDISISYLNLTEMILSAVFGTAPMSGVLFYYLFIYLFNYLFNYLFIQQFLQRRVLHTCHPPLPILVRK